MAADTTTDPALAWLDYLKPFSAGLVVAPQALRDLGLDPLPQRGTDTAEVAALVDPDEERPALPNAWAFVEEILGWEARHVAGSPSGPALPEDLVVRLPEHGTTLQPTWAVQELGAVEGSPFQLLVRTEAAGIDPDARGALDGWEATAHQRFERLLRETGVPTGLLITGRMMRLVYAPKGETSGWLGFPLRPLATVAGRPMLGGLKLLLDRSRLFTDGDKRRLPAILKDSREKQAGVSTALAEQVLGAVHELLRGLDTADAGLIRRLARERPGQLYEGLLAVLMRLVFILYAEDRDLLPSLADARAKELYEQSYSLRGLYAKLVVDAALNPDTMDERRGGWGRLLAIFRLIYRGHPSGFVQARGGKLFDPDAFPFLEGRTDAGDAPRVLTVSDGCVLRILEGLMTLQLRGGVRERLSYRTLDVEQIGSVYETVMGFKAEPAPGRVLAIRAGKNNRTPVFVNLDALAANKSEERIKVLKEKAGRSLNATQTKAVTSAGSVEELAAAIDPIVDERGSPKRVLAAAGTPVLQPTDERRRTGSHYTPRSLTEPIVRHALEPALERLGEDATPDQVLDLKVCDPAMGSGAFLVEACRQIGARLATAWARHGGPPPIPADETPELHARRLVAQRCLYGVDKNPRAVDLTKLSLWLATLARDHEFTFLDHALKEGDSLVGLSKAQIAATHWDASKPPTFVGKLVSDHLREAEEGRVRIRERAEWETEVELRVRLNAVDAMLEVSRLIGDGVVAAFFGAEKPKKRLQKLVDLQKAIQSHLGSSPWAEAVTPLAASLAQGEYPVRPFHWEIEFPEVFKRENPGFDAIIGNPPFLGGKRISSELGNNYRDWLIEIHPNANNNTDLAGQFFRRTFNLLRKCGTLGLVATNKISQGDTRAGALTPILKDGGTIRRAIKRLAWPGQADVVISVLHIQRAGSTGEAMLQNPILEGKSVARISSYLVEGDLDESPNVLHANDRLSFIGSFVLGMGFTFEDGSSTAEASRVSVMKHLISEDERYATRIYPYVGGEEINTSPTHESRRFVFNLSDLNEEEAWRRFPQLMAIAEARVKPQRSRLKREAYRERWWRFAEPQSALYTAIGKKKHVLATGAAAVMHHMIARLPANVVFSHKLCVFVFDRFAPFCVLQGASHEVWSRFFGATFGSVDALTYNPTQIFRTFPFPSAFTLSTTLETAGRAYHDHRGALMLARNEGMTKTYNRFHDPDEHSEDIVRLRELHADMDGAVLRAYGWDDLAARAEPIFLDETTEDDHTYQRRLFWPSAFRDEVLARLLALNAERAAAERAAGLSPAVADDDGADESIEQEAAE